MNQFGLIWRILNPWVWPCLGPYLASWFFKSWALLFSSVFLVWTNWIFPQKWHHVGLAWICHFLVLDLHLMAMGPNLYLSSNRTALFHWTLDFGPSAKVALSSWHHLKKKTLWCGHKRQSYCERDFISLWSSVPLIGFIRPLTKCVVDGMTRFKWYFVIVFSSNFIILTWVLLGASKMRRKLKILALLMTWNRYSQYDSQLGYVSNLLQLRSKFLYCSGSSQLVQDIYLCPIGFPSVLNSSFDHAFQQP